MSINYTVFGLPAAECLTHLFSYTLTEALIKFHKLKWVFPVHDTAPNAHWLQISCYVASFAWTQFIVTLCIYVNTDASCQDKHGSVWLLRSAYVAQLTPGTFACCRNVLFLWLSCDMSYFLKSIYEIRCSLSHFRPQWFLPVCLSVSLRRLIVSFASWPEASWQKVKQQQH